MQIMRFLINSNTDSIIIWFVDVQILNLDKMWVNTRGRCQKLNKPKREKIDMSSYPFIFHVNCAEIFRQILGDQKRCCSNFASTDAAAIAQ